MTLHCPCCRHPRSRRAGAAVRRLSPVLRPAGRSVARARLPGRALRASPVADPAGTATGGEAVGFTQLYPLFSSVRTARVYLLNDLFVSALGATQRRGPGAAHGRRRAGACAGGCRPEPFHRAGQRAGAGAVRVAGLGSGPAVLRVQSRALSRCGHTTRNSACSTSPRSRRVAASCWSRSAWRFRCSRSRCPSSALPDESPRDYVSRVARDKALAGLAAGADARARGARRRIPRWCWRTRCSASRPMPDDAAAMLRRLSGRTHEVISAVWAVDATAAGQRAYASRSVRFAALDERHHRRLRRHRRTVRQGRRATPSRAAAATLGRASGGQLFGRDGPAGVRDRAAAGPVRRRPRCAARNGLPRGCAGSPRSAPAGCATMNQPATASRLLVLCASTAGHSEPERSRSQAAPAPSRARLGTAYQR